MKFSFYFAWASAVFTCHTTFMCKISVREIHVHVILQVILAAAMEDGACYAHDREKCMCCPIGTGQVGNVCHEAQGAFSMTANNV